MALPLDSAMSLCSRHLFHFLSSVMGYAPLGYDWEFFKRSFYNQQHKMSSAYNFSRGDSTSFLALSVLPPCA
jgi:hypothetical protein